jgi:hypothetical protein
LAQGLWQDHISEESKTVIRANINPHVDEIFDEIRIPTIDGKNYNKKYLTPKNNKNINLCWFGELFCALTLFFDHMDHSDLHWRILFYNRFD